MSLILVVKHLDTEDEVMQKIFGNNAKRQRIHVFGHLRLVRLPADKKACFIESMVIHNEMRGEKIARVFVIDAQTVLQLKFIRLLF